ncbi:class I mannose-6-phosphate isomerase [Kribbella sp. NPDC055071]
MSTSFAYDPLPHYPPVAGVVRLGWAAAVATLPAGTRVLAIDGPAVLDWDHVAKAVAAELADRGPVDVVDLRAAGLPWEQVEQRTRSATLADDPDFEAIASGTLADLLDHAALRGDPVTAGVRVLIGPGAAAAGDPDIVWWADLPKRFAEAAVVAGTGRNLLAPAGQKPTTKRLFYVDWPLLDRHRDALVGRFDLWLDTRHVENPTWLDGLTLRATCAALARRPHRTRPTFNTTPWGGQWGRRELGHNPDAENSALGYELIAPESGVLVGETPEVSVEVPFQLVVALAPVDVLGAEVHDRFGTSFPIRFDYLDTVDGGNLSVHCHPQPTYMREVFGWPYTQHETYYLMVGSEEQTVFLGLREGASVEEFQQAARRANNDAVEFDIKQFVQTFPATPHQLFLIPGGTPHGSGRGNVVLEVSATPYLYSLRFYDWLRRDSADRQRPVHVDHAFRNLDPDRAGAAVAEQLVQSPRRIAGGDGWHEELIGALPEMFFEVRRLQVDPGATAEQDTEGRFHVLNVVDGERVILLTDNGDEHQLGYAETIVVPASVGRYTVRGLGDLPARVVKANVTRI